jgi:co-chaperonin GroES (HSP10)
MKILQVFEKPMTKTLCSAVALALAVMLAFSTLVQTASLAHAQTSDPAITKSQVYGKVSEINASAGLIVLKTAAGSVVTANVNEKTVYQRVPPGETDLTKAAPASLTEIAVGDGVVARGFVEADRKSVPAQKIIVVSQSDIAKRNATERAKWAGGVKGIVSSVNPQTKELTVTSRSLMGTSQAVIIPISDKVQMKRYPADSIPKYSEAKSSKFEDVKVGDQLNARGEKNTEGTRLTPEEVVTGSFKIVGGTITAIDPATNELKISDLQTKKPLTIVLRPDSVIRRFPQGGPGMFGGGAPGAAQGQGQGQTAPGAGAQGQPRPQGGGAGGPQGPPGNGQQRPGGGMSMADMLERLPTISLNDLKVGDTIIMSTTQGANPERLTAISMVAGVEQLLAMMAARQQQPQGGGARPSADLNSNFGGMFGGAGLP